MNYDYILDIQNLVYFDKYIKQTFTNVIITYENPVKTVVIYSPVELSSEDKSSLDDLIQNYTENPFISPNNTSIISSIITKTDLTDWYTVLSWEENTNVISIDCISKLEPSDYDYLYTEDFKYSGRVIDVTHNIIVSPETDFTNSEYTTIQFPTNIVLYDGVISLELQMKKYSKGSYVYIKNCMKNY